jgi:L-lysine epsilon oxidase-like protein/heme oxygenase-like protein
MDIVSAKIHPAIGIARVGNSPDEFFVGPESPGNPPLPDGGFKDPQGRIKRQAARFRIYGYDANGHVVRELTADDADITWSVHLANTKASFKQFQSHFEPKPAPRRNDKTDDRTLLEIDPGARTIEGRSTRNDEFGTPYAFDTGTFFRNAVYLGELRTDARGRLLVLGGRGHSDATESKYRFIRQYANNDFWHDDMSDGPVTATVTLGGKALDVTPAWVIVAPPDFAPFTHNLVTAYDVMREVAIANGWLAKPKTVSFTRDIYPILARAVGYTFVSANALRGHGIGEGADFFGPDIFPQLSSKGPAAAGARRRLFERVRSPHRDKAQASYQYMPQLSGDGGNTSTGDPKLWLSVIALQYEFLEAWRDGKFDADWPAGLDPHRGPSQPPLDAITPEHQPAALDRATVEACVGGAFFPGIEITFISTHKELYAEPFRLDGNALHPGDVTRWMAVPWQADFFECYDVWWPAQRPDDVITESAYEDALSVWNSGVTGDPATTFLNLVEGRAKWVRGLSDDLALALDPDGKPIRDPVDPGTNQKPRYLHYHYGDLAMVSAWSDMGFVYPAVSPDGKPILIEHERAPYAGRQDVRTYFHTLLNIDDHPEFLPKARQIADYYLADAWRRMHEPDFETPQYRFFPFTPEAFDKRLMDIYYLWQQDGDNYDPEKDPHFPTKPEMVMRLLQLAPFNQLDGAWLRNITQAGPISEINALLFAIWSDEIGNGTIELNHCNLYTDLLQSVGIKLPDVKSREYADDPRLFNSAFETPVFELAVSQFPIDYFPELLGMTLNLEWEVLSLRKGIKRAEKLGIDAQFYVMHVGIDNASQGHGAKAKRAVELYLDHIYREGGEELVQAMWQRIWTGYVAFAITSDVGSDIIRANTALPPTLQDRVQSLINDKSEFARFNHNTKTIKGELLNDLFLDPAHLSQALQDGGYIIPGDPEHSFFFTKLTTYQGPMYKVFTDAELELLKEWARSLSSGPPAARSNYELMIDIVNMLKDDGAQVSAHAQFTLLGESGGKPQEQSVAWWLGNADSATVLKALSESRHITKGDPAASDFITTYLADGTSMADRWSIPVPGDPKNRTYRGVAADWIKEGCPLRAPSARPAVSAQDLSHRALLDALGAQIARRDRARPSEPRRHVNPYGMHAVH